MSILLKNATCVLLSPPSLERVDLRIDNGMIIDRRKNLRQRPGEDAYHLDGAIVMPGFVCSHTHLYSSLSRGMPGPKLSPAGFLGILQSIWWKLDRALDDESIYYSALVGAIDAVKFGTTTIVDHHASPNHIGGSLNIIKNAMSTVGIRGILCYETTDRGGRKRRDAGLDENARFVAENAWDLFFRGTIGAHASFTLNDDTMQALGGLAQTYECGVHIHAAEDKADVDDAANVRGIDIVDRLRKYGVLTRKSILAHGVHLSKAQFAAIEKSGAWLVHNPRSNMNNAVGYAPLDLFGGRSALGTDGFPADMFEETKAGFFRNRDSRHRVQFSRLPQILQSGQTLVSSFFGWEFGTLREGAPADLIVMHYAPPTPLTTDNLNGHFLFGMSSAMVRHVMVNGEWRMWNDELVGINEEKIMREASVVAKKLWKRMEKMR